MFKIKEDRHPKLFESQEMINESLLAPAFYFVGTVKQDEPKPGEIYLAPTTNEMFLYSGNIWEPLGEPTEESNDRSNSKIEPTVCTHCGAPGIKGHKCEYCGGYL